MLLINIVSMGAIAKCFYFKKIRFIEAISAYLLSNTILLLLFYLIAVIINMGTNSMVERVVIIVAMLISLYGHAGHLIRN